MGNLGVQNGLGSCLVDLKNYIVLIKKNEG